MDPRKLQVGDIVFVDPRATVHSVTRFEPDMDELAVITGIGKRHGLNGIQTPIYVKLAWVDGQHISVPAGAVIKLTTPK